MCTMRRKIFNMIEAGKESGKISHIYDLLMISTIIISIIPLAFKTQNQLFVVIDRIAAIIFLIDYILRLITADLKLNKNKWYAFLLYPFSPMAIIDLLAILPSITIINSSFRLLKIFRLLRSLRVLRVFKIARYSKSIEMIINVFRRQKQALLTVCYIAVAYVLISALVILNIEPDSFNSYFDAIYWATVSLTTMGYGDIYPVSVAGRIVTMISAVFGIAIIALPASIITAGMMKEIEHNKE